MAPASGLSSGAPGRIPCRSSGKLREIYLVRSTAWSVFVIKALESGICYTATLYSALDGAVYPIGAVEADADGSWKLPMGRPPVYHDGVLVLEAAA